MKKIKEPPFQDAPNLNNKFWSQSWFEWFRDVWKRTNEKIGFVGPWVANHFVKLNVDGDLADSDKAVPAGEVVGTTDTQTISNKTAPTLIVTNAPTINTHAANKKYVDDQIKINQIVMFTDGTMDPAVVFGYGTWILLGSGNMTLT